ncbi:LysR family transcriptional regulator [Paraburkholderia caffeinilytica]|uniref:LysR family transcriptional regulator n=1 Tax=Paraburkholderia caffeinilytica TaxID=1761016 RepID=UPI0038B91AB1
MSFEDKSPMITNNGDSQSSIAGKVLENLNALIVFAKVAETRSFTDAARMLGLTASGVSKAITRLEQELGVRLMHRTTRSVSLTNDGSSFFERCSHILSEIEEAEAALNQTQSAPRGRIRVQMPVGFGRRVIVPALPGFIERYPDVVIDGELSDRIVDLGYEGVDVAVFIGVPADARLIARKLCNLRFVTCASPDYFRVHGEPQTPDDLERFRCLAYVLPQTGRYRDWHFEKNGRTFAKTVSGPLNLNNTESLLEAAISGAGIAMISTFIAADAIRAGKLKVTLRDYATVGPQVSVIYLPNRNLSARVRVFVDFLARLVPPNPPWDQILEPECNR